MHFEGFKVGMVVGHDRKNGVIGIVARRSIMFRSIDVLWMGKVWTENYGSMLPSDDYFSISRLKRIPCSKASLIKTGFKL